MELDDLKQAWKTAAESEQIRGRNILAIITGKNGGPVNKLRNRFRKGMIIVPIVIAIALSRLPHHHSLASLIFFPFLLAFAMSMLVYFYYNYQLLGSTQAKDVTVKVHLQKQVTVLENGVRFRLIFTRGMAILFIALTEIVMHIESQPTRWDAQPLITRLAVYAAAFAVFYLLTHWAVKHRYSKNISRLKELVNELE